MTATRRSFEEGIRGVPSGSEESRNPVQSANNQAQRLSDFVSRPLGSGRKTSSLTVRLGDRSLSSGSKLAQQLRSSLARTATAYRADYTISGTRVGTNNLTGAPLANESGSATLHQGLASGSNATAIGIPASKADLPGVPAILTRGSPLLGNRQVLMAFLRSGAFGGSAAQGSSINTNSVPLEDNCDPGFTNVDFQTEDPPEDPPLPPEDQGGSPLDPGEPPPPPVNFNCTPNGCVRSATGQYDTLPECEAVCQQRYSCQNGDCVPDPSGTHANLSLCLNACTSRFTCIGGTCVAFPTGGFASLIDCVEVCEQPLELGVYRITVSGLRSTGALCDNTKCNNAVSDAPAFANTYNFTSYRTPRIELTGTEPPPPRVAPGTERCCTENYRVYTLFLTDEAGQELGLYTWSAGGCSFCNESFSIVRIS